LKGPTGPECAEFGRWRAELQGPAPSGPQAAADEEGERALDLERLNGPWADYDIERHNPPEADIVEGYKAASRAATAPRMVLGEAYGPGEREKLDLLAPAGERVPAIVFIHGGYWRGGAREDRRFPASFFVPRSRAMHPGSPLPP
jgi:acetyl esterase/lipase